MMLRPLIHFLLLAIIPYGFAQTDPSYDGGIPLRTPDSTCPAGSVSGGVSLQLNCCGAGQTHESMSTGSYCCPNANNCSAEVIAVPKCADPSWQLCASNNVDDLGFCCEADWLCFIQLPIPGNGGGVGCSTPGAALGLSQIEASTQYAANAGPGASTTSSTSSTPSASAQAPPTSTTTDSGIETTSTSVSQTTSTGSTTGTPPVTTSQISSSSSGTGTATTSGNQTTSFNSGTGTGTGTNPASESQTSSSPTSSSTIVGTSTAASGLSTGAKIGIGVAVPLALIAAIFGGFLFGKRRRQEGGATSPPEYTYKWPQIGRKHTVTKPELADTGIMEMGDNSIAEMEDTRRHEMEGEGHHAPYAYQQHHIARKDLPQY